MKYPYKCPKCENKETVTKMMAESSREEKCSKCDTVMKRVWTAPSIATADGRKF